MYLCFLNLLCHNDVSASKLPQDAVPLPISCLFPVGPACLFCTCGLGLCPFSGLVYDLLLRDGGGVSPECALPEEYLGHNLDEHCLEDTGPIGALPTRGSTILPGATFLGS